MLLLSRCRGNNGFKTLNDRVGSLCPQPLGQVIGQQPVGQVTGSTATGSGHRINSHWVRSLGQHSTATGSGHQVNSNWVRSLYQHQLVRVTESWVNNHDPVPSLSQL